MNNPLSIFDLLNDNSYSIPLYQRNFAWTDVEITQLIIDVLDSIKENRPEYFIGTLVVSKNGNEYSIIDGQQRFTSILLIALAIQNEYSPSTKRVEKINLCFSARKRSNDTLSSLFLNDINTGKITNDELRRGYGETVSAIKEHIGSSDYLDISIEDFYGYLFDKVKIFISEMPEDLDVNLYFERFNSRGEQLEYHEIIKAELMQRLVANGIAFAKVQKFAKVWDACSEFETPCIKFFKKKTKGSDADEEREKVFKCEWSEYEPGRNSWRYGYSLKNIYSKMVVNKESKKSLISAIEETVESGADAGIEAVENEDSNKYRCIVNFNTFLYYVLYLTDNVGADSIQLDDKKLKSAFKVSSRDSQWILSFGENLLKAKFIFDNLIIRSSLETTNRRKEGEWFLQKAYREDKNEKARGHLYVQTRFDKNSFPTNNHEILMLQSMFAVTFTAYKDTKWLYSTLKYLFENADKLNEANFGDKFYAFLESMSKRFAIERICNSSGLDAERLRYNNFVPVYAFNLTDYVLWKNREKLGLGYTAIKFDDFRFTYRRSIEHWYPQNPNETEGKSKLPDDLLHCFGNLCLIVASQNSAFGNLYPLAKLANWRSIFSTQSLKLQMMAANTDSWSCWDETKRTEILEMEKDILQLLKEYIY
ncbi:DUF262 domain-containing protein [Mesobacillus subterraneus]|uniref:DUF262 domain-containing protein n=1 Tax=Mesobacillus subterraneus TaxID=285983 RepID=A0A0D6ZBK4_9BACI|nr:DUF262 domain-containing protein [Mesobacillus subterraneus]KIY23209.1 hypothetical protein UB32_04275 [Mesobacillus subterraneus]